MSHLRGKAGERIREFWKKGSGQRDTLRAWMKAKDLGRVSTTVFTGLAQMEYLRSDFLKSREYKAAMATKAKASGAKTGKTTATEKTQLSAPKKNRR